MCRKVASKNVPFFAGSSGDSSSSSSNGKTRFTGLYTGPYFDPNPTSNPTNVTVQLGETALLPCRVKQLGSDHVVRRRDGHIIAVGEFLFIEDDRFFVLRDQHRGDDNEQWSLYVKHVSPRDSGAYECQISTAPKMSRVVELNVKGINLIHHFHKTIQKSNFLTDTRVEIVGNSEDVHANIGSRVVFKCKISGTLQKPAFVFWYD